MEDNQKRKNEVALHPLVILDGEKTKNMDKYEKEVNDLLQEYNALHMPCNCGEGTLGLILFSTLDKRREFKQKCEEYLDLAFGNACVYLEKKFINDKQFIKEAEQEWKKLNE